MRSATCEEERIIARPPAFVGDLHQDRYKLASANRLGPARQPQLGFGREIALDCDAAADVWACSRPRFPSPSQRSLADALSHGWLPPDRAGAIDVHCSSRRRAR
jgi:hypothetical protein